jgi:hypothetical protein
MLADLEWKSLQERQKEARLIMLYKVINNKVALDNSYPPTPNLQEIHTT